MSATPWGEGTRLLEAIWGAGFAVKSWNLYPGSGTAQVVVDLGVKHTKEEGK